MAASQALQTHRHIEGHTLRSSQFRKVKGYLDWELNRSRRNRSKCDKKNLRCRDNDEIENEFLFESESSSQFNVNAFEQFKNVVILYFAPCLFAAHNVLVVIHRQTECLSRSQPSSRTVQEDLEFSESQIFTHGARNCNVIAVTLCVCRQINAISLDVLELFTLCSIVTRHAVVIQ